jgi:hypothetical protein
MMELAPVESSLYKISDQRPARHPVLHSVTSHGRFDMVAVIGERPANMDLYTRATRRSA